jgi:hypothetical protein
MLDTQSLIRRVLKKRSMQRIGGDDLALKIDQPDHLECNTLSTRHPPQPVLAI